jgi:hypothetical protein
VRGGLRCRGRGLWGPVSECDDLALLLLPGLPRPPHILPPPCWPFLPSAAATPSQAGSREMWGEELSPCLGARGKWLHGPPGVCQAPNWVISSYQIDPLSWVLSPSNSWRN